MIYLFKEQFVSYYPVITYEYMGANLERIFVKTIISTVKTNSNNYLNDLNIVILPPIGQIQNMNNPHFHLTIQKVIISIINSIIYDIINSIRTTTSRISRINRTTIRQVISLPSPLRGRGKSHASHGEGVGLPLVGLPLVGLFSSCSLEPADYTDHSKPTTDSDRLIVLCEGLWGMDNASLSLLDHGVQTDHWFQRQNPGRHLGDTGNDILQVNDTLVAISVNWSNIIQYIRPDGTAIAATENIPNNRRLATDHLGHLYVTSYADKGYVAKIDLRTKQVVDTCHVGYEPEGIAYFDGRLYVANTGGYSTQTKDHAYEQTISVVDAATMRELRRIDTGCPNLFGTMSTSGQYACINSAGDYYMVKPRTIILNMANDEFRVYPFPATYSCAAHGKFYLVGSSYSYLTGEYEYSMHTISAPSLSAQDGLGEYAAAEQTILGMQSPYGLYISPYSLHLYVADARAYATNGYVHEFAADGTPAKRYLLRGVNPSHFVAVKEQNR